MNAVLKSVSVLILAVGVLAAGASLAHAQAADAPKKKKKVLTGRNGPDGLLEKPAPELSFKAYGTSDSVDLKDFAGKLVVVDFFNAEYGRDGASFDTVAQIGQQYGSKGVAIVGVSTDVNQSAIVDLLKKRTIDWPFSYDGQGWSGKLAESWHVASGNGGYSYSYYRRVDYLVSPDGIVIWTGNPDGLDDAVQKALKDHKPTVVNPRTMVEAKAVLDKVNAALKDDKLAEAYRQRAHIPRDASRDDDFAASLKQTDENLQTAGDSALAAVDPLVADKKYDEAAAKLKELSTAFDGTPMAPKAKMKLNELQKNPDARVAIQTAEKNARADDLLKIAQKMQADKKDVMAYAKFKLIAKDYAGSPAGATAAYAVATYDADPAFKKKLAADPSANASQSPPANTPGNADASPPDLTRAKSLLGLADSYRDSGNFEKAKAKYNDVITQFPTSPQAAKAKEELAKLPS